MLILPYHLASQLYMFRFFNEIHVAHIFLCSGFCFVCLYPVSCVQFCLCHRVVHSRWPLRLWLTLICFVSSCVLLPVLLVSHDCPFLMASSALANVHLFCFVSSCVLLLMLLVSLGCPFLIAYSALANVNLI